MEFSIVAVRSDDGGGHYEHFRASSTMDALRIFRDWVAKDTTHRSFLLFCTDEEGQQYRHEVTQTFK